MNSRCGETATAIHFLQISGTGLVFIEIIQVAIGQLPDSGSLSSKTRDQCSFPFLLYTGIIENVPGGGKEEL
jgi:hypothetical protein